ncbi:MAG: hypothetical protein WCI40_06165, partial [Verrucomicrobiota bacterium]
MKTQRKLAAVVAFALVASMADADIMTPGMIASDSIGSINSLETVDGFSAQFWMTTDDQIFSTWAKTSAIRNLKPTIQVKRNTPIYLALFMANPGVRILSSLGGKSNTTSDVSFDLYIINPSGTLSLANKQRIGWRGVPPSPGLVYLAKDRGVLNFEVIDSLGQYSIVVVIHDNIRRVDMKLTRKLELVD